MTRLAVLGALCALALGPSIASTASAASREVKKTAPAAEGAVVEIENLAGTVRLEPAAGGEVEIVARLTAEGDSAAESDKLLAMLDVEIAASAGHVTARAKYPLDSYSTIHYPDPRRHGDEDHGFLSFLSFNRSTVRYQGRRVTVISSRKRHAPTLYADFQVKVPRGVSVTVRDATGLVSGNDVRGAVSVDCDDADVKLRATGSVKVRTGSGDVLVRDANGESRLETGSGDVTLDGVKGAVSLHTGSGDVKLSRADGDVEVDTGSGDATLKDVAARHVRANTGSGNVVLDHVTGALEISTGSGDIQGRALVSADSLRADTGSGNLTLQGDFTGVREIRLETSSGDIELSLARTLPMRLVAKSSGGDIDVDLPELHTVRKTEHELVAEVGGGGTPVRIETSSGSVRVAAR